MSSKLVLDLLALTFYYSSEKLQLTCIRFYKGTNQTGFVDCSKTSKRTKYLWSVTLIVSLVITTTELPLSLYSTSNKKIISILYHLFQFIVKASSYYSICVYNIKSNEIACFFNCICKRYLHCDLIPAKEDFLRKQRSKDWKQLELLAIFIAFPSFVFYVLLLPLVSISFSELHESLFIKFVNQSYKLFTFKICLFTLQVICYIPTSAIVPVVTTSILVALGDINSALKNLW